jgi:hypothetical protein
MCDSAMRGLFIASRQRTNALLGLDRLEDLGLNELAGTLDNGASGSGGVTVHLEQAGNCALQAHMSMLANRAQLGLETYCRTWAS